MTLRQSGSFTATPLRGLVTTLNALPLGHMSCPANAESVLTMNFHYAAGPDVAITMGIVGCWNASNGAKDVGGNRVVVPGFTTPNDFPGSRRSSDHS